jgi:hypothetical protein
MIGNEQWAEVSQEADVLELEVYAKQDGQPWKMTLDDALDILAAARERLKA